MTATLVPIGSPASRPAVRRTGGERIALAALLLGTAALLLWNLGAGGWANTYYAGAVQAMTKDWTAFFFGSVDAGNVVTVDKPPAALWVMALSGRVFGFSSWSMLVPQALIGVGAVALLYAAVRRVAGPVAGLLAGAVLALTPVVVEMFRYNNPDALLVLLLVAAAYASVRAIEAASTTWLLLAGTLVGLAFLTKMAPAFVPLPALALAYLVAAPTGLWRRVRQLLAAGVAIVLSAGWWFAVVEVWPTGSRPYIGGSETDSALELALGYNGLGRIFGGGGGATTGGMIISAGGSVTTTTGPGFGSEAGPLRMFDAQVGPAVSWLLPAALALLVVGLWLTRRAPRTDRVRASLVLWGAWTAVTALVFSLAQGIFHSYYTVALAPGIAALVGIGGAALWPHHRSWPGRAALVLVVAGTAAWAWVLLTRSPDVLPWLRWVVAAAAAVGCLGLLAPPRRWTAALALALVLTGAAAPAAYAAQAAASNGRGVIAPGPMPGSPAGADQGAAPTLGPPGRDTVDPELVALLQAAGTTWAAATVGAQGAATLALAGDVTVMGIGGFSGGDPAPTLEEFQAYVAAGEVRYFVPDAGGMRRTPPPGTTPQQGGPTLQGPGGGRNSAITTWVQENFASFTVGDRTIYDLTQPLR
ncbi:glycosyltransferase family 39 protein [Pseudonocardia nigra]|uniref:glycosyltransferase family 39 protein n=1 Tax=Pseudonocardia nigra TaxID=1921578 RepID=UPI001C5E5CE9|nr:glycosyltransferase family 39 protein [Pseudonocardia nigra]